jgi:hypothetical protein
MTDGKLSLLCAIAFHYIDHRFPFLSQVLESLSDMERADVTVRICTNTVIPNELKNIEECLQKFAPNCRTEIRSFPNLAHPFDLVWSHKEFLPEFCASAEHDLFLYLEDDMVFREDNVGYFLEARELLDELGLIPSFVRYEVKSDRRVLCDGKLPTFVTSGRYIRLSGRIFLTHYEYYCAVYLFDKKLAQEHIESFAFREETSRDHHFEYRERAAMGNCSVNVPEGRQHRYVVELGEDFAPLPHSQIFHSANNYTGNLKNSNGKIWMDEAFLPPTAGSVYVMARNVVQKISRQFRWQLQKRSL